ncbi:EamA family transporter [Paenibacillus sp. J2TS4]|uniref:EamA family transporter n=1 Tax=Paenibacillus sp. J2TS4 TaxID=2807194 RepID=UPI001B2F06DC|nr:EamA family transporter [Paenibacillus sp. J2TS4]GIP32849.1 membrane protein [Paenibacillus sp. J2TS4]
MTALLIVLANVLLLVTGQLLWKITLNRHPIKTWDNVLTILLQPSMILGCILFAAATLIWFYALSRYNLSRIYPLQSMAYVLGAVGGVVFLRESMSVYQWLGLFFIVGGAFLLSKS